MITNEPPITTIDNAPAAKPSSVAFGTLFCAKKALQPSSASASWSYYDGLFIHPEYFKYGLVLIREYTCDDIGTDENIFPSDDLHLDIQGLTKINITDTNFCLKDRELALRTIDSKRKNNNKLVETANPAIAKKAQNLLAKLVKADQESFGNNANVIVVNTKRREEVFVPFCINDAAFYVYPWLSRNDAKFLASGSFNGFKQFVTAGYLFGPGLKAIDQNGYNQPLIKYDIKFGEKQKIVNFSFNLKILSPYETMLFKELEKYKEVINNFSNKEGKSLVYHLPYYDYVLFGIELYMRGRLTFPALDKLVRLIYLRKELHKEKVNAIFGNDIAVKISSPFEPIFAKLNNKELFTAKNFFEILEIKHISQAIQIATDEVAKNLEKQLVDLYIAKLSNPEENKTSYKIWQDFVEMTGLDYINNLKDLFKIANSIMVAIAAQGHKANEVCSLLPVSEKQIQVNYAEYVKADKKGIYPSVFNFTVLDPLLSYGPNTKGLLFYFDSSREDNINNMINKGILQQAQKNLIALAKDPNHNINDASSLENTIGLLNSPRYRQ